MPIAEIKLRTSAKTEMIDITLQVQKIVTKEKVKEGLCLVFVPHTTAAVTINENADPSVKKDIIMELNKIVPFVDNYSHLEGNAPAHIKSSIVGAHEIIAIHNGTLQLGTWQGIMFCEFDGPRNRRVIVKIISD